mgnify:CR=1 FL=1
MEVNMNRELNEELTEETRGNGLFEDDNAGAEQISAGLTDD